MGEFDRADDVIWIALHKYYVSTLNSNVRTRANSEADVSLSEGRSVIDAIADHADFLALRLQLLDLASLLTGQNVGEYDIEAEVFCDALCGAEVIASKHSDLDSKLSQFSDRDFRPRPRGIGNGDKPDDLAGTRDMNDGASRALETSCLSFKLAEIEPLGLHQPPIA